LRWLQLGWRAWMTEQLVGRWMEDGRHYRLNFTQGQHDNPDQRIAEDIRIASELRATRGLVVCGESLEWARRHPLHQDRPAAEIHAAEPDLPACVLEVHDL
jgi:hypothetical protein